MTNSIQVFSFLKDTRGSVESQVLKNSNKADQMLIQIDGEFTGGSVQLMGCANAETKEFHPIYMIDLANPRQSANVITSNGMFTALQVGLVTELKIVATDVAGNITVFGKLGV